MLLAWSRQQGWSKFCGTTGVLTRWLLDCFGQSPLEGCNFYLLLGFVAGTPPRASANNHRRVLRLRAVKPFVRDRLRSASLRMMTLSRGLRQRVAYAEQV